MKSIGRTAGDSESLLGNLSGRFGRLDGHVDSMPSAALS
jgi:hypothetical protein